jgi:signal transduction histidine kinase
LLNLKAQNTPIEINFNDGKRYMLYFDDSPELKRLVYFPYIQFIIIGLFIIIGYIIFSTFRKAEQNQVWAGMAKETAHQLGTPISSLMAWVEYLKTSQTDEMVTQEMEKDIDRLTKVTERFSKIGSGAKLEEANLYQTVSTVTSYLLPRISDKINVSVHGEQDLFCRHNAPLMEWVIENICKNAIDAMENKGSLDIWVHQSPEWAHIDIKDTGKGLLPNQFKSIFQPGFTTKKRGWGLGLSLVKRIIKEYHKGKVFVLQSEVNVGTTFRISIPM